MRRYLFRLLKRARVNINLSINIDFVHVYNLCNLDECEKLSLVSDVFHL